jgi:YVTN family beta-propeller protein
MHIEYDPVNKRMHVTNFLNGNVTVIDATTNIVIDSPINLTDGSSRIEYDPVNKRMYNANFSGKTVSVINVR